MATSKVGCLMRFYDYRCLACDGDRTVHLTISEVGAHVQVCGCGTPMRRAHALRGLQFLSGPGLLDDQR